ncbi:MULTISPECIES: VOC family protein [Staphylococcus]|uniref:VOC family protein n=1 Tax=Staphylococcus TaxID=1279 RepID=UPI001C83C361|nr:MULTISPECIES: VOC family protein [Staphylococcus]MBX5320024.1 VOC family protein [Staphylococcus caprae]MCR6086797.1 VOC family protein [Staphylococcus aureus]
MKSVNPFIYVKDVDKSLSYYKDVFQANTEILIAKDGKTYHAQLIIGENTFVHFSDTFHKHFISKNPHLLVDCDSKEELERVYQRLIDDGGHIKVKLYKTFFNAYHAEVKDRLNGITWVFNYFIDGTF